jgi:hypothetical protein
MNRKLISCTKGHTIQFFVRAVVYVFSNFSEGLEPSIIAMELKNMKRFVGAKRV